MPIWKNPAFPVNRRVFSFSKASRSKLSCGQLVTQNDPLCLRLVQPFAGLVWLVSSCVFCTESALVWFVDPVNRFNRFGGVEQPGVSVSSHRQADVAVPHRCLGDASQRQKCPETVPQRMDVNHATVGVDFRDSSGDQVPTDDFHQRCRHRKYSFGRFLAGDPNPQLDRQV